eukprot:TRINITY_DN32377_c0_g1_i1.p1 TRINITY_DN32377_c0_g1~~TRINITY_DN32377_c0_g1_i1.p1  ORF type:complete len:718 (+),score=210.14 TRINITY_DN32377_c0_g1_i1:79-2232(+)
MLPGTDLGGLDELRGDLPPQYRRLAVESVRAGEERCWVRMNAGGYLVRIYLRWLPMTATERTLPSDIETACRNTPLGGISALCVRIWRSAHRAAAPAREIKEARVCAEAVLLVPAAAASALNPSDPARTLVGTRKDESADGRDHPGQLTTILERYYTKPGSKRWSLRLNVSYRRPDQWVCDMDTASVHIKVFSHAQTYARCAPRDRGSRFLLRVLHDSGLLSAAQLMLSLCWTPAPRPNEQPGWVKEELKAVFSSSAAASVFRSTVHERLFLGGSVLVCVDFTKDERSVTMMLEEGQDAMRHFKAAPTEALRMTLWSLAHSIGNRLNTADPCKERGTAFCCQVWEECGMPTAVWEAHERQRRMRPTQFGHLTEEDQKQRRVLTEQQLREWLRAECQSLEQGGAERMLDRVQHRAGPDPVVPAALLPAAAGRATAAGPLLAAASVPPAVMLGKPLSSHPQPPGGVLAHIPQPVGFPAAARPGFPIARTVWPSGAVPLPVGIPHFLQFVQPGPQLQAPFQQPLGLSPVVQPQSVPKANVGLAPEAVPAAVTAEPKPVAVAAEPKPVVVSAPPPVTEVLNARPLPAEGAEARIALDSGAVEVRSARPVDSSAVEVHPVETEPEWAGSSGKPDVCVLTTTELLLDQDDSDGEFGDLRVMTGPAAAGNTDTWARAQTDTAARESEPGSVAEVSLPDAWVCIRATTPPPAGSSFSHRPAQKEG